MKAVPQTDTLVLLDADHEADCDPLVLLVFEAVPETDPLVLLDTDPEADCDPLGLLVVDTVMV